MKSIAPSSGQIKRGSFKLIEGVWHQRCSGPAHDEPAYLPATDKYFHRRKSGERAGELISRCRLCINWDKLKSPGSEHGYVAMFKVRPFYEEAVNRIGIKELAERAMVSESHIESVLRGGQTSVQKQTFRRVMLQLVSIRRKNEHSIVPGARWRNERRIHSGRDVCPGCGTPKANFTKDCESCTDRLYRLLRSRKITRDEFEAMKP